MTLFDVLKVSELNKKRNNNEKKVDNIILAV